MSDQPVIILCVSRGILDGADVDRNAAFMAARIGEFGFRVRAILIVDRVEPEMVQALEWAAAQSPSYLLVTGGLGLGIGDNTRACAARAFGLTLQRDAKALEFVRRSCQRLHARGTIDDPEVTDERRRLALLPKGAVCHENTIGSAPAVQFRHGGTTVFLLPGPPAEMQRLFTSHVLPAMKADAPGLGQKPEPVFDDGNERE